MKNDVDAIYNLQQSYKNSLYLKMREYEYIQKNINNFFTCKIEKILIWSIEYVHIDEEIVELWALVIDSKLEKLDKHYVCDLFIECAKKYSQSIDKTLISLTNNLALQQIFLDWWLKKSTNLQFIARKQKSHGVALYYR